MEIGSAQRALAGQDVCGDMFVVLPGSTTIIGLADGLGHGPDAAAAARLFCAHVREHGTEALEAFFRGADRALTGTRGAAGALLRIEVSSRRIEFAGVGNVDFQAFPAGTARPFGTAGILGRGFRKLVPFDFAGPPGGVLALFTDGISSRMSLEPYVGLAAQALADQVLAGHGAAHDDATCVVVKL
jgi:phosphoserine phosphatase RsbX